MATNFTITSKVNGLVLHFGDTAEGTPVDLWTANANDNWEQWQFFLQDPDTSCFQIINAHSGNQMYAVNNQVVEQSPSNGLASWGVRPPNSGPDVGQGYYELIWAGSQSAANSDYLVMNVPDHLLKKTPSGLGVPMQVSGGNGGQTNELWTLTPNSSASLVCTAQTPDAEQIGEYGGVILYFELTGYKGKSATVSSLGVPSIGQWSILFSEASTPSSGTTYLQLLVTLQPGSVPNPAPPIGIAALDESSYAIAFTSIPSSWWYADYWV